MMPHATLAAVVIIASIGLISPKEFRAILQIRAIEFRWALIAVVGVLLLGVLKGILVAVLISMVSLIVRGNMRPLLVLGHKPGTNVFRPQSAEHPDDETYPGLLLLRPEGSIYFANAPRLGLLLRMLMEKHSPRVVALDLRAVPDLEYTALRMLDEGEEQMRANGITLWLVSMNPEVLAVVERSPLGKRMGHSQMFVTLEQAVAKYLQQTGGATEVNDV
jgi:MFS superfamily sulfate permease-like transporter